jgi:hypothetical protein
MPLGVSDEGAVILCRDWMRHLGATDTIAAVGESRTVCDLFSSRYLAWVDNHRGNLEIDRVARAAYVALHDGRQPLIFKRGGIRLDARRRADLDGVALFSYVPSDAVLAGANPLGHDLRLHGLLVN